MARLSVCFRCRASRDHGQCQGAESNLPIVGQRHALVTSIVAPQKHLLLCNDTPSTEGPLVGHFALALRLYVGIRIQRVLGEDPRVPDYLIKTNAKPNRKNSQTHTHEMLNNTRTLKALATQHLWWCLCILRQELRGFLESCPPCLMQSLHFGIHGCGKGRPWMEMLRID